MQNNSSDPAAPKGTAKALKYILAAFVAVSIGAVIYKMPPCCSGNKALPPAPVPVKKAATPSSAPKAAAVKTAAQKNAVVYYFYTNTRCSSCKTIEAYTRAAVQSNLTAGYKDWKIEFQSVNVEEAPNAHFVQDYWLNSKSVVIQKFSGDKPLKYAKLEKVWQLLSDKTAFVDYITAETHKLLDEK